MWNRLRAVSLFSVVRRAKRETCKWPRACIALTKSEEKERLLAVYIWKWFERFCLISRYRDGTTGEVYRAQVALQLLVKPGSYRAGHSHRDMDANELLDQNLGTENLEWYLENQGSVVLTTLLIKIEPTWRRCHPRSPNVDPMSWFQRCVVPFVCRNQNFPRKCEILPL